MKNRHYTPEEMVSFYADWQQSKLCKAAYCQKVGLAKSTFSYWIRKLKLGTQKETPSRVRPSVEMPNDLSATLSTPGFIELDVSGKPEQVYPIVEIDYPSGARLRCYTQPEASWLKTLL